MNLPIKLGIVGYGYWGPNLARNFSSASNAHLSAVCDLNSVRLDHLRKIHPNTKSYSDLDHMLSEADLDAVVVATPPRSHHALATACLLAGKHVLIEKPMACSSKDCEDLITVAGSRKLILMVGHTYLYSSAVSKITQIIQSGDIGEICYINCQRRNLGIFRQDINVAWDLAPHDLSVILHVMGEMPQIVNCQGNAHINPESEDVTNLSLTFCGNRFATIQSSWLEPKKVRQMTFVGTRKMILYDDLEPLDKIRIHDVRVGRPSHYDSFSDFNYAYHYGDCHIPHIEQREPLIRMCHHFLECIMAGSQPDSCGVHGLDVVRILEACEISLKAHGGPVTIAGARMAQMPTTHASWSRAD